MWKMFCSFWCWNQADMELNIRKTFPGKVKNLSTIPRDMLLILDREIGLDTNHGNQPNHK